MGWGSHHARPPRCSRSRGSRTSSWGSLADALRPIAQASKEESELKEVEDRIRDEERCRKLAIAKANKMEVTALTEKVRLSKQRKQLVQNIEEERKALRTHYTALED